MNGIFREFDGNPSTSYSIPYVVLLLKWNECTYYHVDGRSREQNPRVSMQCPLRASSPGFVKTPSCLVAPRAKCKYHKINGFQPFHLVRPASLSSRIFFFFVYYFFLVAIIFSSLLQLQYSREDQQGTSAWQLGSRYVRTGNRACQTSRSGMAVGRSDCGRGL